MGEASNPGPQLSRQRSPSQGSTVESVMPASEELMDAKRAPKSAGGPGGGCSTWRLERWCWSQELQVILLFQVSGEDGTMK